MVLKDLQKRGFEYRNLAQVLADVDMLGYTYCCCSIILFPKDETRNLFYWNLVQQGVYTGVPLNCPNFFGYYKRPYLN